jgi:predicted flavoprotein YhiN
VRAPHRHFISDNPNFCRSALSRYTPRQFLNLVNKHGIGFHEKHKGQLFCDRSAEDLINLLLAECAAGSVQRWQPCAVHALRHGAAGYEARHRPGHGALAASVVVATRRTVHPEDWRHRLRIPPGPAIRPAASSTPRPALVPLTFDGEAWTPYAQLAGLALPVQIETGTKKDRMAFNEDLLFTHRGLSGPAVLQISSYWQAGSAIRLNLAPATDLPDALARAKLQSRKRIANELASLVPSRLADAWVLQDAAWQRPVNEASDKALACWPSASDAGKSPPPAPRATRRPKSRPVAWTPATCPHRPWNRGSRACISSAKWWT